MSGDRTPPEGPWDPNEQVGDIYSVEVGADGITNVERLTDATPRIWIASLSDYNNGILHGEWIDAAREPDEIYADIQRILAASPTTRRTGEPAEEWAIHDFDNFGDYRVHEHDQIESVARVARGIAEHGLAFAAYADVMDGYPEALDGFQDAYLGHYDSVEEYARQVMDDLGNERLLDEVVPESLRPYVQIDYKRLSHDWLLSGDFHVINAAGGGVWLFDSR